jgi:predicted O-methyltransferase YrrM
MSTLNSSPVNAIIDRLYDDAQRSRTGRGPGGPGHRREDGGWSLQDAREYWTAARHKYMAVSRETGRLLYVLARTRRAQVIVEFGASFGISTLHLAAALRDCGGGRLITTEYEPNKVAATRAVLSEAGLGDLVEVREGEALETLAGDVPTPIDFLFLDGAKPMYLDVLRLLMPRLAPGAVVLADNSDSSGARNYRDYVRTDAAWVSTSTADRTEISVFAG